MPETCPVCGAAVPRGRRSCPECGADERTGWDEERTRYDGLDLPDSAFDDDNSPRNEEMRGPRDRSRGVSRFWFIIGLVSLLVIAYLALFGRHGAPPF